MGHVVARKITLDHSQYLKQVNKTMNAAYKIGLSVYTNITTSSDQNYKPIRTSTRSTRSHFD